MRNEKALSTLFFVVVVLSCCVLFFSCGADKKARLAGIPAAISEILDNSPEDVFVGVGVAEAESDGEALFLAESRARENIARQINTQINNVMRQYTVPENDALQFEENVTTAYTSATVSGSRIVRIEKNIDGTWWCVVWAPKLQRRVELGLFSETRPDAFEVRLNVAIPEWVLKPNMPEDVIYGLGAAKLKKDEDSIALAKERARRSLAHAIETNVTSMLTENLYREASREDNQWEYKPEEYIVSNTSIYNHTSFPYSIEHLERTKDGTWWVCCWLLKSNTVFRSSDAEKAFNAEERMNQAFEKALNAQQ